jgi:hypothetical protein
MSDPAIYIAVQGTTRHVPPRYTVPDHPARAPRPPRDPRSHGAVFRNSHTPYGIRNSEIGIRKPGTPEIMVRLSRPFIPLPNHPRTPIRGFSFLSVRYPRNERAFTSTIKRAPSPLSAPAIAIHPSLPNQYFVISGGFSKTAAAAWGPLEPPAKRCGVRGF